jgi:arabinose-5-phosphate isomerase
VSTNDQHRTGEHDGERAFVEGVLRDEADAVAGLIPVLGESFHRAVSLLETCADSGGTVLVTGLGKSGLVGAKIAATMSSLGIPAHAVHPAEAAHGDLGRFRPVDTVVCLSHSGETDEVVSLAAILAQDGLPIISITGSPPPGNQPNSLERLATAALHVPVTKEAGHPFVAPTSSTTAAMAIGDALALATARRRNFTDQDFAKRHPGGALGGLLRPVTDVLRFSGVQHNLPLIPDTCSVEQALAMAAELGRRPGAILIVHPETGALEGIFTDGDLRRLILHDPADLARPIANVMTRKPRTLNGSAIVRDAVRLFQQYRQDEIPVVDDDDRPIGILDVQDLIAMKLVRD